MRLAVPVVLQQDLSTTRNTITNAVEALPDAYQAGDAEVLETTVELRGRRLRFEGTVRDLSTQHSRDVWVVNDAAAAFIGGLDELARRIDPQSGGFSTRNSAALQSYVQALVSPSAEARIADLQKAINLDPAFGLAYLGKAQIQLQSNAEGLAQTLAAGAAHRAQFSPLDRARFDSFAARASHAPLAAQASATQTLLNLTPNDTETLTLLGSERFLLGDASEGERLLRRALALNPDNVSIRQQLSLGLLQARQFQAAEKVLAGLETNASVLPELAVCALLRGDAAKANAIFTHFVDVLQGSKDQAAPLSRANWLAIAESPAKAAEYLEQTNFSAPDLQSLAMSQKAVYQLMDGNASAAKGSASAAIQHAVGPVAKRFALVAALAARSDTPHDQFEAAVNSSPLDPGSKALILAYGLFFQKQYAESAELWREIVKQSGDTDLRSRAMLASALTNAGRAQEAEAVRVQPFVPNLTGGDEFAAVAFQQMRKLMKL